MCVWGLQTTILFSSENIGGYLKRNLTSSRKEDGMYIDTSKYGAPTILFAFQILLPNQLGIDCRYSVYVLMRIAH